MDLAERLKRIALLLIDQRRARVIVPPQQQSSGYWFGGGNMVEDAKGILWLVGRYRNHGDSRTGLHAGERGLELAIFRSADRGQSFEKSIHFTKSDLDVGAQKVLSIEGRRTAAHRSSRRALRIERKGGHWLPRGAGIPHETGDRSLDDRSGSRRFDRSAFTGRRRDHS